MMAQKMQTIAVETLSPCRFLLCPDCHQSLDDALNCPSCRRSLAPDADGIINAMPLELGYAAKLNDLQTQIDHSSGSSRDLKVVRYEESFHNEQAAYYDEMNSDPEPIKTYIRTLFGKHIYSRISKSAFVVDLCCGTGKGSIPLL